VDGAAAGTAITWHQLIYYSYVTLTSTGYGDILPVSLWARSAATLEAILGILYITVIMSRLVGIYSTDRRSESDLNL
jgi:nicotinamide riboside transporter PnuC